MKKAIDLLSEEWDLGSKLSQTNKKTCAQIYLLDALSETEQLVFYREDKNLIGFAGYSNNNSRHHFFRKKFYKFLKTCLINSWKVKKTKALKRYYENYSYTPSSMEKDFDGEVTILILDKRFRGKGIGRKMLEKVFSLAKKDGMKNLQILTDESCNHLFYSKLGCVKVYETMVKNFEYDKNIASSVEKGYIYKKSL